AVLCPSIGRSQIGQRTLIIGRSPFGLGTFSRRLPPTARLCRVGRAVRIGLGGRAIASGRLARFLILLGGGLVRLATVIRLVEAGPLEEDGSPRAEQAAQLLLAALGTLRQDLVVEVLKLLEGVLASVADVVVGWHGLASRATLNLRPAPP